MGRIGQSFPGKPGAGRPEDAPPGSEEWKAEREAEEMKGERRQANGDARLMGQSEAGEDPDAKKDKLSIDLDPSLNF